jgi:tetratricopeptide (TPR) repeat protein
MNSILKTGVLIALIVCNTSFAQQKTIQDAYKKFSYVNPKNDLDKNLQLLDEARVLIDAAAMHEETKSDSKMHYYRCQIYYSSIELLQQKAMKSGQVEQLNFTDFEQIAYESYNFCITDPKEKYKSDITSFFNSRINNYFDFGVKNYQSKNYEQALALFFQTYNLIKFIKGDTKDTYKNIVVTVSQIVDKYTNVENPNYELSITILKEVLKVFPEDVDFLISLSNQYLKTKNLTEAEKIINQAAKLDPNNKQLHYVIGSIQSEMHQNENAEIALNKAIQIDPDYQDALYQLGAHLITWGGEVRNSASSLKIGDPNYEKLMAESDAIYTRAINPLEKYISINPNNVDVLNILSQLYRNLSNYEKANEYKKKAEAVKQ